MAQVRKLTSKQIDPSQTGDLRRKFEKELADRFKELTRRLKELIQTEDAFGLGSSSVQNQEPPSKGYVYAPIADPDFLVAIQELQKKISYEDIQTLEDEPHITLMYGLDESVKPEEVLDRLQFSGQVVAKLGRLSLFKNDGLDVLKYEVKSTDLNHLRDVLEEYPYKTDYPEFVPHVTVAYLQPNTGWKYLFRTELDGRILKLNQLRFVQKTQNTRVTKDIPLTVNGRFEFLTTDEKLAAFRTWLGAQLGEIFYDLVEGTDDSFWVQLAQEAYFKGAGRAFDDTEVLKRRENLLEPDKPLAGLGITREQFLRESFAHPVSVDRIKVLASRVLTELNGVTSGMDASLSRVLVDGLTQGKSPYTVAREITKEVGGIEKKRAKVIARTETIRAHAEGQLDSLERLGVEEVGAAVEWATAGDGRVCPKCRPLDGIVLKLKEARGLLPRHPNCRCAWEPANVGEPDTRTTALGDDVKQKRSKSEIQKALDRSIAAELPKTKERTLDEQKKLTKWVGADTTVDTKRPKSILDDDYTGNFNPGQPRDSRGRWSSGGAGGTIDFDSFKEGRGDTTFAVLEATAKDLSDRWDVSDDDLMALAREEYSRPAEREWLASKTPGEVKEGLVLATLKKWTGSSGGPIASSVAVAASKKHGSTQELRLHPNEQSVLSYLEQRPAANRAIGSLSDAMYEGTQKWFADREIKEITVYRKGGLAEDRPFSSWTISQGGIRHSAGGELVKATVPVSQVLSTPATGFGTLTEAEVVLIAGPRTNILADD